MSYKEFDLPEIGVIKVYKRSTAKSIRLSVTSIGEIKVSIPKWVAYQVGLKFVVDKKQWLQTKKVSSKLLHHNQRIGKSHRLLFISSSENKITTRVTDTEVRISRPDTYSDSDSVLQKKALEACKKALKKESSVLLTIRTKTLAIQNGFKYKNIAIKHLKSRWGSCNQDKEIVFNSFLIQLPWDLIDYVILHELTHTMIMKHGSEFWHELQKYVPDLPERRKRMRLYQPTIITE
ncbi:MAG: SprT family zinc-dependent metalloprotease [Candidatus Saccharimonadales bacterium]